MRYLAKGNPLAEVADPKERLRTSEYALRRERQKYTTLLREHEELLKASTDFESEQYKKIKRLANALQEAESTIDNQRGALEVATTYMKKTEAVNTKNWELMNQLRHFQTSLGVISPDPTHESGDGLASIGWMSSALATAMAASIQWGHHCARVAWTGAFNVMKSIIPLLARQIKDASKQLRVSCGEDYVAYKRLQTEVVDAHRYFGRKFWGPSGLNLARSMALEAAEEDLSRASTAATQAGPSTRITE